MSFATGVAFVFRWLVVVCLLSSITAQAASTITYYHNDLTGSPLVATDASGHVLWRESYRPYGERLVNSAAAKGNDVWFTSRRQDVESGLVYMGARYYDPVAGRFASIDPKQFDESSVSSFGRYTYANDNPYKYVDPDGRASLALEGVVVASLVIYALEPQEARRRQSEALANGIKAILTWASSSGDESSGQTPGPTEGKDRESTLRPGPHAGDSIPARGPDRDFTPDEREKINEIGDRSGCHSCGASDPGTKSGNWVPDHQRPSALNPEGTPQRLYPQCLRCSQVQGGQVRGAKQSD